MTQDELVELINKLVKTNTDPQKNRNNIASEVIAKYVKLSGATINAEIIRELDANYNKDGLTELTKYVQEVVRKNKATLASLPLNLPYSLLLTNATLNKAQMVWGVAVIFCDPVVYGLFRDSLSPDVSRTVEKLVWLPKAESSVLAQLAKTTLTTVTGASSWSAGNTELKKEFKVMPFKGGGWHGRVELAWPPAIRAFLQTVYPQPADYLIRTIPSVSPDWTVWDEGETIIFEEIQKLVAYRLQDGIQINSSGKVAGSAYKKMRKLLGLREFMADNSPFPLLRTTCVAQMMASFDPKKGETQLDSMDLLNQFYKLIPKRFKLLFVLNEIKNHGYVSLNYYKQDAEIALVEWLTRLPVGEWVSTENILAYAEIHDLSQLPCPSGETIALAYEFETFRGTNAKSNIGPSEVYRYLKKPTLLAGFYVCAALGWLDVAFTTPDGKLGQDFFSGYDTLKAVRLNGLGAHIAGRTKKDYTPKVNTATQALRFDEQSLLIFCDPSNVVAETILANYAERVSPTRFRVTAQTFLKDCKSKAQLVSKVSLFTKSIAPDLPTNWLAFFDELTGKAEPLELVKNMTMFRVSAKNQTLIRLLAQDEVLKTMVAKAEGFRILVADDQLTKFKNRLRELGYLIG